jgi:dTDP-4-amino-4,6-dideoxygalactose transaminase
VSVARLKPARPAFLPYGRQVVEDDDIAAVTEVLRGDYLTTGPAVARFEAALSAYTGAKHAVVCANGTAALHMAARALNLGAGRKVIVPAVTFLATASAPHMNGADIVFADVDPTTGLMTPETFSNALMRAGKADAVFNVHLNGQCGALEEIAAIARIHGLKIVDDACHALGAAYVGSGQGDRDGRRRRGHDQRSPDGRAPGARAQSRHDARSGRLHQQSRRLRRARPRQPMVL